MTDGATVSFEDQAEPRDDAEFAQWVAATRQRLDDPRARFSASQAVRALRLLRAHARERAEFLDERREILSMIGRLAKGSMTTEFEEGLEPLAELMAIGIGKERPAHRRLHDHLACAQLSSDHATLPGNSASHAVAADQYGAAAAIADTLDDFTDDQRGALRQEQAYEFHEAERFEEALSVNHQVIKVGERIHGADSPLLASILTNLAQNLHALGRREEIEPFLVRVQRIGEAANDIGRVEEMLFQRGGVLAYELGRSHEARALMQERIERLDQAQEPVRLRSVRDDYEELERRILADEVRN